MKLSWKKLSDYAKSPIKLNGHIDNFSDCSESHNYLLDIGRNSLEKHPIKILIERADKAIIEEDFETLLDIYTDNAVLVIEPGRNAVGKESIKLAFEKIAVYFKNGLQVKQNGMEILESDNTALVLALTEVSAPNYPPVERKATYVFEKTEDGIWLCSVDNSYGHDIIQ